MREPRSGKEKVNYNLFHLKILHRIPMNVNNIEKLKSITINSEVNGRPS